MSKLAAASIAIVCVLICCLPVHAQVVINELMYSPRDGVSEAAEYLELFNPGTTDVDLSGWSFSSGIKLTFPPGSSIGAGRYLVIARDPAVFRQVYGFNAPFVYGGKLDDGGELITLVNATGIVVDTVQYSDEPPWPVLPDGLGPSLEVIDPLSDNSTPRNWRAAYLGGRTPGARNSVAANGLPPWITKVDFKKRPGPGETVEVSATIADAFTTVLTYRVNSDNERTVSMTASGSSPEGKVYKGTIPGQPANSLVRLRLQALGANGSFGYPRFDDTIQNTGYFIDDPALTTQLPTIHWFIDPSRYELALQHAHTDQTEPAALVYDGEVYDSVQCRVRGGSARWWPKLHWKFVMPKAHDFTMGQRLARPVDRFNLQGSYSDKTYLREILAWESFQEAGVPSNQFFHVRLHQNNKFFGLYLFLEQPDDDWLARHGLSEDAAHYKADGEKADCSATTTMAELMPRYEKESRESEDYYDLWEFFRSINTTEADSRRRYLFDHVDIPAMVNYLAVNTIIHNNDHIAKNYYLYRDTEGTGRWRMFPWDMDLTFGRNYLGPPTDEFGLVLNDTIWADIDVIPEREDVSPGHPLFGDSRHQKWDFLWNRLIDGLFQEADIRAMYFRRLRTLMDLLLVPGKYESRIDALVPLFQAEAQQDSQRWLQYGEPQTLGEAVAHLRNEYLPPRRQHLFVTHRVPGEIPEAQTAAPRVLINEIMYAPPQGTDDEFVELFNASWDESVDLSGWTIAEIGLTIPPGTVILPRDYVVFAKKDTRFRQIHGSGLYMAGEYKGSMPDANGVLTLANATGSVIDSLTYSNLSPWPGTQVTTGSSLERIDPDKPDVQASNWAASSSIGGSPCTQNSSSHVASSRSFVPMLTGSPWPMAALAVSNAGTGPASVQFIARALDGTVAPTNRVLPPNGQLAELATDLFPGLFLPGWVEIRGENKRLGSLQMLGGLSQLDGGPTITSPSRTIYLAPVFSGSAVFWGKDARTFVHLANPNANPVTLELKLWEQGFPLLRVKRVVLAPHGMLSPSVSELFGSSLTLSSAYIVAEVTDGDAIVASHWVEVAGGSSLFCLPAQYPVTSTRLFSAQFATLPNLFTEVVLLNQAQTARSVRLKVWSETGSLFTETEPITIAAGAMVRLDGAAVSHAALVGSLEVQANGPGIAGCVIFGDLPNLSTATALPLQSDPFFREAVFSHLANGAGYYTGLAFYNPGNAAVTVRLTVFDQKAVKTGQTELTLPAKARKSALLHELLSSTAGQVSGFVHLAASGPVIAQQVFADTGTPRMSAVPPTALR